MEVYNTYTMPSGFVQALELLDQVFNARREIHARVDTSSPYLTVRTSVDLNKIALIKQVRELSGLGLKESKELVEFFEAKG